MTLLRMYCGRGFESRHLHHFIMFNWFKKKKAPPIDDNSHDCCDAIEQSLWEIKEEYDFPTEEIINVVSSKRKNLDYMHKLIYKKQGNEID